MGRLRFVLLLGAASLAVLLPGCGKKSSGVNATTIHITQASISLEQGKYAGLTVSDSSGTAIAPARITWLASDSSAISVATLSGLATVCAGSWNSATAPTICTPGPAGAVRLTASAEGATSPPITVFVHQHIERLEVAIVPQQVSKCDIALNLANPVLGSFSTVSEFAAAEFADYTVTATNNGADITSTIGPISWAAQNTNVVALTTTGTGLLFNQARATARMPGQTTFYAAAGSDTSAPVPFITCPVAAISLATSTGENSLTLPRGSLGQTITPTVHDLAGLTLLSRTFLTNSSLQLTWSSSNPTVAAVTTTGVVTGAQTGGASITTSCLPTNCNIGFLPPSSVPPVHPTVGISVQVSGTASSSTAYVASSGCWDRTTGPILGCLSYLIPIPQTTNIPGAPVQLPYTPTSLRISPNGTAIYAGSCVPTTPPPGQPVCNGIAVLSTAGAVTTNNAVTGDVIGVSVTGNKAVVSDTSTTPNQVFLYDQPSNAGTPLLLATTDHARSAEFSPDAFEVYIATYQCTGSPCQASNEVPGPVYVYDAVNGLRRLATPTGVTDIAFHPSGAFVYLAQAANRITVLNTATNTIVTDPSGTPQVLATPGTPQFIRAVRDWDETAHTTHFVALNGPNAGNLDLITATTPTQTDPQCTLTSGVSPFTLCHSAIPAIDLGQGPLAATQFLLSTDGTIAYVVAQNFSSVFSYNLGTQFKAGISLIGGQPPTTGGLTSDGAFLYVGSADGLVHVLNTGSFSDILRIQPISAITSPSTTLCSILQGQPCNPDFVLVSP